MPDRPNCTRILCGDPYQHMKPMNRNYVAAGNENRRHIPIALRLLAAACALLSLMVLLPFVTGLLLAVVAGLGLLVWSMQSWLQEAGEAVAAMAASQREMLDHQRALHQRMSKLEARIIQLGIEQQATAERLLVSNDGERHILPVKRFTEPDVDAERIRTIALNWLATLYRADGPDPEQVYSSGLIRYEVPFSAKGSLDPATSADVRDWLLDRGIIFQRPPSKNYWLDVTLCPTLRSIPSE